MASRKDRTPVRKRDDPKPEIAGRKGDFTATNATQREWQTDAESAFESLDSVRRVARVNIRRPDDLFVAELSLYNLKIVTGPNPRLKRDKPDEEALLVIKLPPQSFGEQAYLENTGPEVKPEDNQDFVDDEFDGKPGYDNKNLAVPGSGDTTPLPGTTKIRISGPSRLAFVMPRAVTSIPYTLEAVLEAAHTWHSRRPLAAVAEPALGTITQTSGSGQMLSDLVGSDDFVAAIENLKGTAQYLKTTAPSDKRLKSIEALQKQFADVLSKGLAAADGKLQFGDLVATPQLPLLATPFNPGVRTTALELPYRLITSPIGTAIWAHRTSAAAQQGRHELWHTRLTSPMNLSAADTATRIRAIWSDDYRAQNLMAIVDKPFRMPLDAQDRRMLVQLMVGFGEKDKDGVDYMPRAAKANRLILSALGGLLDAEQSWTTRPDSVDLQQWRHMMSLGRDHYVRVVYAGYLLPFGHAASLIKVTERKFEDSVAGSALKNRVAVLRQRFFIVVREPVKTFDGTRHSTGGHPFPFTSVEVLTRVTPNLQDPKSDFSKANQAEGQVYIDPGYTGGLTPRQLFWPMMELKVGADFRFDLAAVDRAGRRSTFSMPLLFMSEVANTATIAKHVPGTDLSVPIMRNVQNSYNAEGPARREVAMGGASICYAPPDPGSAGDTRMPTQSLTFKAGTVASNSNTLLNTYPEVKEARVTLLAAQRILGKEIAPVRVKYYPLYSSNGFGTASGDPNTGEVFLELIGAPFNLAFGGSSTTAQTDVVGAVASPTTSFTALSRKIGLASDLTKVKNNEFDPQTFLGDAKILGSIVLKDYLPRASLSGAGAPKFVSREIPASGGQPARVEARYDWETTLSGKNEGLLLYKADGGASPFRLRATTTTVVGEPNSANTTTDSTIGNFKVNLFGFIVLWFRELNFKTTKGQKPVVQVDLHPTRAVEFGGALEFVNQLKDLLPGNGFADPSALSVTANGIEAKYSLTIPRVQVGIFDLSGLSVGARFTLPFDVRPMEVGFNFADRENPFSLTVSLLGGGGFVAIGIGADGIREIEAAIEAAARLAIDLGVASGSVEIKAGIYFHWLGPTDSDEGLVQLTGYVRVHGELDVMAVISISITFNLSLTYEKRGSKSLIWGEASVTVEIEVLVFSGEVTVRCRREFVGSDADPKFAQLVPADTTWSTYCSAFAEA